MRRNALFVLLLTTALLAGTATSSSVAVPSSVWPAAAVPSSMSPAAQATLQESDLSGLQFRTIGPATMSGRFVDVAVVESDPYVIWAASATGGVWKSINNGVTWAPVFEDQGTHSVGDIAIFQPDPDIVWVGTGERANRQSNSWGDGVYKTTDGGETWENMGLRDTHHIGRVATHPSDPGTVWVAGMGHLWGPNEERGLFRTTDGGNTWEKVLYIDQDTGVADVVVDPSDPDILYAAAYQRRRRSFGFHGGGPGSGLYKSTDGGDTWEELREGLPEGDYGRIGITIYPRDPSIVYISLEQGRKYTASTSYEEPAGGVFRSTDRGETWEFRGDWNPRPMYASQPMVDPNDPDRIYMMNSWSVSTDGGRTFERLRQSVHGDDRFVWVDPDDSRHLIKASDGALAISYDRGETWLWVSSLPVSQFYRVGVDMSHPYRVCGGLQDNGAWCGPNATYRSEGVLNEDWFRIGGGDGFVSLPDPSDPSTIYTESQYLGLSKVNVETHEDQDIRPDNARGYLGGRRNWDTYLTDRAAPLLGKNMAPANWDGPFILSPHDPETVYAGTNEVWKSTDGGASWESLVDPTTRVDRTELTIMGEHPSIDMPSLDDGIPYFPTTSVIAESPLRQGLLYVGTDDGNVQVSLDDGETWDNVSDRIPGLPEMAWINGIEPSRFDEATVYLVVDNHRLDDFDNYAWKSTDYGQTWTSIVADLPEHRVLRTLREDTRNPEVLYVGAELGLFVTVDGGDHWVELKNDMPTLPFNDLVIHPRENDLVLGSHGRGVWILDQINALQELTPEVMASRAWLFTMEPAEQIRYSRLLAQPGDMIFRGENPPEGAIIDYWLGSGGGDVAITVHDADGERVASVEPTTDRGVNRVVWDLRHEPFGEPEEEEEGEQAGGFGFGGGQMSGPLVVPGTYTVRLAVDGQTLERPLEVREDPRMEVAPAERRAWTRKLLRIGELWEAAGDLVDRVEAANELVDDTDSDEVRDEAAELARLTTELHRRIRSLYGDVEGWTGGATEDQQAQLRIFTGLVEDFEPRVEALEGRVRQ